MVLLRSKDDWSAWMPETLIKLQEEGVAYILTEVKPYHLSDYDSVGEPYIAVGHKAFGEQLAEKGKAAAEKAVCEWLAEKEEVPVAEYSAEMVADNFSHWGDKCHAIYNKWNTDNSRAYCIIFDRCAYDVQRTIMNETSAKKAWRLLSPFKGASSPVYQQLKALNMIEQVSRDILEESINKFQIANALLIDEEFKFDNQVLADAC